MTKEVLKMALEALFTYEDDWVEDNDGGVHYNVAYDKNKVVEAINAIKEALAQPEPWEKFCDSNCVWTDHHPDCKLAQPDSKDKEQAKTDSFVRQLDEALAQQALDRKAENARELGLDYEPENSLYWHALNYRTAPTQNAKAMFEALERFVAQPEQETQAYREVAQLAKWLFKKHYAQEEHYASGRVVWGLCDTTVGVISQIDNMVCKLVLPKEPEQETVAYQDTAEKSRLETVPAKGTLIYTTPPQRTWTGLTDEEVNKLVDDEDWYNFPHEFAKAVEAKLRSKNI